MLTPSPGRGDPMWSPVSTSECDDGAKVIGAFVTGWTPKRAITPGRSYQPNVRGSSVPIEADVWPVDANADESVKIPTHGRARQS